MGCDSICARHTIQPSRTSHEPRFTPRICAAPDFTAASVCGMAQARHSESSGDVAKQSLRYRSEVRDGVVGAIVEVG